MTIINEQEMLLLEHTPATQAIAQKLKEGSRKAQETLDEAVKKQRELSERLASAEAEKQTIAVQARELEQRVQAEKEVADTYRSYIKEKKGAMKMQLGDFWLPEYESDSFSLGSLEKVAAQLQKGTPPGTIITPPGKQPATRRLSEMAPYEREAAIAKAKGG